MLHSILLRIRYYVSSWNYTRTLENCPAANKLSNKVKYYNKLLHFAVLRSLRRKTCLLQLNFHLIGRQINAYDFNQLINIGWWEAVTSLPPITRTAQQYRFLSISLLVFLTTVPWLFRKQNWCSGISCLSSFTILSLLSIIFSNTFDRIGSKLTDRYDVSPFISLPGLDNIIIWRMFQEVE